MIKTISNPSFADRIISRHMTLLSITQSTAELLFARSREHDEGGSRFSQSIRNVYFLNRLTNENNIFNIHLNLSFLSAIVSKTVREMSESVTRHIHMLEKTFATGRGEPRQTQRASLERPAIFAGGTPVFLLHRQLEAVATKAKDELPSSRTTAAKENPPHKEAQFPATKNHASLAAKTIAQSERVIPAEHGALRQPSPEATGAKFFSAMLIANRSVPVWHRYLWDSGIPEYRNHADAVRPQREKSRQDDSVSTLPQLIPSVARLLPITAAATQQSRTSGEIDTTQPQAKDMKSPQAKAPRKRELVTNATVAPPNTTPSAHIHPAHPIWPESASKALQSQRIRPQETDNLQPPGVGISELENRLSHPAKSWKPQAMHHIPQVSQAEEKSTSPIIKWQPVSTKMITLRESSATIAGQVRNAPKKDFPRAGYPQKIQHKFLNTIPMPNIPVVNDLFPFELGEPSSAYIQPRYILPARRPERADGTMLQIPIPNRTAKPSVYAAPHMLPAVATAVLLPAAQETPARSDGYSTPDYTRNLTHAAKLTASGIQAETPEHRETRQENRHAGRQPAHNTPAAIIYKKEQQRENPARHVPEPVRLSEDIEFIKKSVKLTAGATQTVRANTAVNAPGTVTSPQGAALGIDQQVNAIADKVYSALERRLRSERMRKGLL